MTDRPTSSAPQCSTMREMTLRGIVLGAVITVIFTAANVYLGLKLGLTFASSIPAAIISMTLLRMLGNSTILENNMVQTQASAAGTLSCVFAALPGLVFIGWWQNFPYITGVLLTMAGGMTGVLFTIPLRRALVSESDLPYPEGRACAEILRASSPEGDSTQLRLLSMGAALSALVSLATSGLNLLASGFSITGRYGASVFSFSGSFSLALLGTGYLVGITGGIAMLTGVLLAWDVLVPLLGVFSPSAEPLRDAPLLWAHKVRFIGAGVIAIAALWILVRLSKPVFEGIKTALSPHLHRRYDPTEHDLSPRGMLLLGFILATTLFGLFIAFLHGQPISLSLMLMLSSLGVLTCLVLGFLVASACGYMAGIIGSSSSPISGIGIIAIILITLGFGLFEKLGITSPTERPLVIAFSLFLLSAITASAAVSNDNLQDLKTGKLLGATAWKQEATLLIGCAVGALVIPWLLQIVYDAYGLAGHMPRAGMDPNHTLPAPQSVLMAALAQGIITHTLDWTMLAIGAVLGILFILIDATLNRINGAFPPLAVGMGLYLPPEVSVTVAIGAGIGWILHRQNTERSTMLASGFIVGESLMGIALAGITTLSGHTDTFFIPTSPIIRLILGWGAFGLIIAWSMHQVHKGDSSSPQA